jgi:microcystin-dependent protein
MMTIPYIGEIQIFGFGFAPPDWTLCDGSLLAVSRYPKLFALIGTTYGGDGVEQFRVPNLAGRAVCGTGTGSGSSFTPRKLGDSVGANSVSLTAEHLPPHGHGLNVFSPPATVDKLDTPKAGYSLSTPETGLLYFVEDKTATPPVLLEPVSMAAEVGELGGGDKPHENRQPFLALNFYIAVHGNMPSFS